jgi:hypothetical protein
MDGTSWQMFRLGDQRWQEEAWRQYDICGELRYASNWMASAISRCRLYVAKIDKNGKPGEEVKDPKLQMIAETAFGSPAQKAEAQRLLGSQLYVSGDSYIVAEAVDNAKEDRWYVVSSSEVRMTGSGIQVRRSHVWGGGLYTLDPKKDLIIRCWTPHPRFYDAADSSVRAALPILREIEQLSKKINAQIDSRLSGAGVLFVPEEIEFPSEPDDPPGAQGFMLTLQRAMEASIKDQASASALVPIIVQVSGEQIKDIKWQTFETPLQGETMALRDSAIRRLALSLDVPPEILLGQGDSNHWSAWQIEESVIKLQVEPMLTRIADALTMGYLKPALKAQKQDPDEFTFWFDTSPLAIRPDRQKDALDLYLNNIVGADTVRKAGNWSEDDAPTEDENARQIALEVIKAQPAMLAAPDIQAALGVEWDVSGVLGGGPAAAPTDQVPPETADPNALPDMPSDTQTPAQEAALLVGADLVVRRALELAGKSLLTRGRRGEFGNIPAMALHTVIEVTPEDAHRLVDGRWEAARELAKRVGMDPDVVVDMLATYTTSLIAHQAPHTYAQFSRYIDAALQLVGHDNCHELCLNPLHPGPCAGWHHRIGGSLHFPGHRGRSPDLPKAPAPHQPITVEGFDRAVGGALTGERAFTEAVPAGMAIPGAGGQPTLLTADEQMALGRYTFTAYKPVNNGLRDPKSVKDPAAHTFMITNLDAAMAKSPTTHDIVVSRGVRDLEVMFGPEANKSMVGAGWVEHGYVSTSTERGVSSSYGQGGVVLRILVPKGTGALTGSNPEKEIILKRGLRLRVVRDTGPTSLRRILDVMVVDQ